MSDVRKEFLLYLDSWPDSSLEALVLIYQGDAHDIDLSNYQDEKIQKFLSLVAKLRNNRRHDELQEIYEVLEGICQAVKNGMDKA